MDGLLPGALPASKERARNQRFRNTVKGKCAEKFVNSQ
jgi:hypothetical protein